MPGILTLLLISFASYILLYAACWSIDKTDIEKHNRKIKLNKYTNILFFLWSRNEKVYWLVYVLIISESIVFILLWISYITNVEYIFKILFRMYIYFFNRRTDSCNKGFKEKSEGFYKWQKVAKIEDFIKATDRGKKNKSL